jgi:hypothetical protein
VADCTLVHFGGLWLNDAKLTGGPFRRTMYTQSSQLTPLDDPFDSEHAQSGGVSSRLRFFETFLCNGANRVNTFVKVSGLSRRNSRLPIGGPIEGTRRISKIFIRGVQSLRGRKSGGPKIFGIPLFSATAMATITKLHQYVEDLETHKIFQHGQANLHNF